MTATPQRASAPRGVELAVTGMTCLGCVNAVTRALSRVPGVSAVDVDLDTGRVKAAGAASPKTLIATLEKAGYGVHLALDGKTEEHSSWT